MLDGPKISGDNRGWYAIISERKLDTLGLVLDCDVWHPKDNPNNPNDIAYVNIISCADTIDECIGYLIEDGWLSEDKPTITDYPKPSKE